MTSIVKQLEIWANNNATTLREKGAQLIENFPKRGSSYAWKANIGIIYSEVIVSYTVWERSEFQTELIVMNSFTKETILIDDKTPKDPNIVHSDLDNVVTKLFDNSYKKMNPNQRLIIK